jgi:hypothetical protein
MTNQTQKKEKSSTTDLGPMQSPLAWWDKTHQDASTLSRWIALYEAVNIIADKAEEKGIPVEKVEFKPLAIHKYMESTENIILMKILEEQYKIKVCYSEDTAKSLDESYAEVIG